MGDARQLGCGYLLYIFERIGLLPGSNLGRLILTILSLRRRLRRKGAASGPDLAHRSPKADMTNEQQAQVGEASITQPFKRGPKSGVK